MIGSRSPRTLRICVLAVLVALFASACLPSTPSSGRATPVRRVLLLGDSVTYGLFSTSPRVHEPLSAMLADRLGRRSGMEGRLRKLIALKPDYAHAYNALGYSLADRNERLDEAEALIRRAVSLRPDDPFIMDSLGWVRYRQGAFAEARQILEKAYALRADPEIAAHLGEVMWEMGDRDAARSTWEGAAKQYPDNSVLTSVMRRYGL